MVMPAVPAMLLHIGISPCSGPGYPIPAYELCGGLRRIFAQNHVQERWLHDFYRIQPLAADTRSRLGSWLLKLTQNLIISSHPDFYMLFILLISQSFSLTNLPHQE
jgi:hypothetical protein